MKESHPVCIKPAVHSQPHPLQKDNHEEVGEFGTPLSATSPYLERDIFLINIQKIIPREKESIKEEGLDGERLRWREAKLEKRWENLRRNQES